MYCYCPYSITICTSLRTVTCTECVGTRSAFPAESRSAGLSRTTNLHTRVSKGNTPFRLNRIARSKPSFWAIWEQVEHLLLTLVCSLQRRGVEWLRFPFFLQAACLVRIGISTGIFFRLCSGLSFLHVDCARNFFLDQGSYASWLHTKASCLPTLLLLSCSVRTTGS